MVQGTVQRPVIIGHLRERLGLTARGQIALGCPMHMTAKLEPSTFDGIVVCMIRPITTHQDNFLTGLGTPAQSCRKTLGNHRTLSGEKHKIITAIQAGNLVVAPDVLALRLEATTRIDHAFWASDQRVDFGLTECFD